MIRIVKLQIDYINYNEAEGPFLFCSWFGRTSGLCCQHVYHRLDGPARFNIALNNQYILPGSTYWYNGTKFPYLTWKFAVDRHRQRKQELSEK